MTMLSEKVVVTAKDFLGTMNINDTREFTEPLFATKMMEYDWDPQFSAASIFVEIVWKIAIGETTTEKRRLDRLFTPSPIATHANFRGCRMYKSGNVPEPGAIVIWRKGNSWQGSMAIVTAVAEDKSRFDVIEGRLLVGSNRAFIKVQETCGKWTFLPFKEDKMNIIGFIYPPNREIA